MNKKTTKKEDVNMGKVISMIGKDKFAAEVTNAIANGAQSNEAPELVARRLARLNREK